MHRASVQLDLCCDTLTPRGHQHIPTSPITHRTSVPLVRVLAPLPAREAVNPRQTTGFSLQIFHDHCRPSPAVQVLLLDRNSTFRTLRAQLCTPLAPDDSLTSLPPACMAVDVPGGASGSTLLPQPRSGPYCTHMILNDKSRVGLRVYAPGGPQFTGRLLGKATHGRPLIHRSNAAWRVEHYGEVVSDHNHSDAKRRTGAVRR
jgi:hypothetical protein